MALDEETNTADFLSGGGEMGAAIRAKDWAATPLGPPEIWPPELRTVVRLMLTTGHPIFIFWGPELICLYNDAYSRSIGSDRHPGSLGRPGREVWEEIWDIIGPQIDLVLGGRGATWHEDHLVPITRDGVREDVYWTYSYSPIGDPTAPNGIGGVLVICSETTERVRAERRLKEELAAREVLLDEVNHRIKNSLQIVSTLLRIEARAAETEESRHSLRRASARVDAVSSVHELIYRSDDITTVPVSDYVAELCNAIGSSFAGQEKVTLDCEADELEISTDTAIAMALLINELVTNAYKHAFPGDRSGTIRVRVRREDDAVSITVADDGVGAPPDAGRRLGSRIIDGLVQQLDAEMRKLNDGGGHCVEIRLTHQR